MSDWVNEMFPGDGLALPSDEERDRADAIIAEWAARWQEEPVQIARRHRRNAAGYCAGRPTNRAYLRAQLRRWWAK